MTSDNHDRKGQRWQVAVYMLGLLPLALVGAVTIGLKIAHLPTRATETGADSTSTNLQFRLHAGNARAMVGKNDLLNERWADIAGNFYSANVARQFSYEDTSSDGPRVWVRVEPVSETFRGRLEAHRLKPNFAYQLKLAGDPTDMESFERIGYFGRWRLPGRATNYSDWEYQNYPEKEKVEAYILFDFFVTDARGNAVVDLELKYSCHVLRNIGREGVVTLYPILKTIKLDATDPRTYVRPKPAVTEERIGAELETMRYWYQQAPPQMKAGHYTASLLLTEESFHSSARDGGWWATPLSVPVEFDIVR